MAIATNFSTGPTQAEDFNEPVTDFIYAECKTNEWYSQGEADAHLKVLLASFLYNGQCTLLLAPSIGKLEHCLHMYLRR